METERLMDIQEVAAFLNINPGTLYHWVSERRGPPCIRISSRCIRWRMSDVNAWISERADKSDYMERGKRRKTGATQKNRQKNREADRESEITTTANDVVVSDTLEGE